MKAVDSDLDTVMSTDAKLQYFENYEEGWNEHDPEKVMKQFVEGGTYYDPNVGEQIQGQEIAEYVAGAVNGFPDLNFEMGRKVTSDEENEVVLMAEWVMHGTHTGTLDGLPPTGNTIAVEGIDVVTISDDGIISIKGYFDTQAMANQLGLTFPTIIGQLPKLAVGALKQAF